MLTGRCGWWVGCVLAAAPLQACIDEPREVEPEATIRLVEEVRIGSVAGDSTHVFGAVAAVAPGPGGSVYIGDRLASVVRRYDVNGRHERDIGRRGQGPGEYLSIDGLGFTDQQELIVWDDQARRVSYFTAEGEFVTSVPVLAAMNAYRGFSYSRTGDVFVRVVPSRGFRETDDGLLSDWARVTREGATERIWEIPPPTRSGPRYVLSGHGGYYRPFVTETLSAIGPDGSFYTMRNDEYRIAHHRWEGRTTEIVRSEPRVSLSVEELREWRQRSEHMILRDTVPRSTYLPIPRQKPYVRELVVDVDSRLWVSRYTPAAFMEYSAAERTDREARGLPSYQWRDLLRWDVFSQDDQFLGTVVLPFKTTLAATAGDVIWGVQAGDYNEEYVVRWRMENAGR